MSIIPQRRPRSKLRFDEMLDRFNGVTGTGSQRMAKCPAHDDAHPSLSIKWENGTVLMHCFGGCTNDSILESLGISYGDLFDVEGPSNDARPNAAASEPALFATLDEAVSKCEPRLGPCVARYYYETSKDKVSFAIARFEKGAGTKTFRAFQHCGEQWRFGAPPGPHQLYLKPRLDSVELVIVVEGEKCADALTAHGYTAITSAHGARSADKSDWSPLAGKHVVICPDNNVAGSAYADSVARILRLLQPPSHVRVLNLPNLPRGGDIVDFIDSRKGHTLDELRQELESLLESAPEFPFKQSAPHLKSSDRNQRKISKFHRTELGNAYRLVDRHGEDLRFVPITGNWLAWDGVCWNRDVSGAVMRRAQETVLAIYKEPNAKPTPKGRKEIIRHATRSETAHGLRAMINLAESNESIQIDHDDLDAQNFLLNVRNGTIDLSDGQLRPHRRDDYFTRTVDIEFDPLAKCPIWMKFLDRIFGGNQAVIAFVQRAIGYTLSGQTSEQCLFLLFGIGANGKTTLLRILLRLLGPWGKQAELNLLIASRGEVHPTGVADLVGSRLVVSSEIEQGKQIAEVLVKQLTGQDRVKARLMRQDFFEFEPRFKIWIAANHKPRIVGTDEAIWRRIHLVPFDVTIPPEERDKNLIEKLEKELPGILTWAVRGFPEWLRVGLSPPAEIASATNSYRADSDVLGEFLIENCVNDRQRQVKVADLYSTYTRWAAEAKEAALSKNEFRDRLIERGFQKPMKSTRGCYFWKGIELISNISYDTPPRESGRSGPRSVPSQGNPNANIVNIGDFQNGNSVHSTPLGGGHPPSSQIIDHSASPPALNADSAPPGGNSEAWGSGEGQPV